MNQMKGRHPVRLSNEGRGWRKEDRVKTGKGHLRDRPSSESEEEETLQRLHPARATQCQRWHAAVGLANIDAA